MKIIDNGGLFSIKDDQYYQNQKIAGKILSNSFKEAKKYIKESITTNKLNSIVEEFILDNKAIPTFKGYLGFPSCCCISVNNILVHGIPNEYQLKYGDIIKIDAGVTYGDSIADSAFTVVVGNYIENKYKYLLEGCKNSIDKAVNYIKNNKLPRVGDIGFIIETEAKNIGAKIIKDLTGHGLEKGHPHFFPIVYNYGIKNSGPILLPGTTICIEPMFVYGSDKIKILDDNWSVYTEDIGMHFEHTIFIKDNDVEIITKEE